jgi:hypothetical protein
MVNLNKWNEIPYIKELCWHISNKGYVQATIPKKYQDLFNGKCTINLHNLIYPCDENYEIDHSDRNKLNNLAENLSVVTRSINMINTKTSTRNTSGVRGVSWASRDKKWLARINVNKNTIFLGLYSNKEDAIRARLQAERQYYDELAPQKHLFKKYNIYI